MEGLDKTIQSVISQSYEDIEYIVIDGGSLDGSKDIIRAQEDHIAYWVSERDSGIYNAMNKGIRAATGDYLLFINSGDFLVNKTVISEVVEQGLTHDLICGNLIFEKETGSEEWIPANEVTFKTFLYSTIPHPTTLIKRNMFDVVGMYNEDHKIVSDWEFFILATCKYNCTYQHTDVFITAYSDGGVSSNPQNFAAINKERQAVLNKNFSYFIKDYESYDAEMKAKKKEKIHHKVKRFFKSF
jgi:glycosyltransferase involved in cell wall biosynthesis